MAANTGSQGERKIYYNISYGMLSTKMKEFPEGYEEIKEAELKSKTQAVDNIDLRKKYIVKSGDYPYQCFYNNISGTIQNIEKESHSKGVTLKVDIVDQDGDNSTLQTKFYGKVASDFLNRLLSIKDTGAQIVFNPYQIPTESEIGGNKIKYYASGVSLKEAGEKLKWAFTQENGLPSSERIKDAEGKDVTSRVKQIDFLFEKVSAKYQGAAPSQETKSEEPAKREPAVASKDSLPF